MVVSIQACSMKLNPPTFKCKIKVGGYIGCVCEGGSGRPCARGLQAPVFAALARERARLPGVKYDDAAGPWRNAARLRFYAARLTRA